MIFANTKDIGDFGEDAAVKYLKKNKYKILERNLHISHNEIDIIADDGKYIVFVEVKCRNYDSPASQNYGRPSSAVTYSKQQRTLAAARSYLRLHPKLERQPRIDVIEVFISTSDISKKPKICEINHIRNAFGA